MTSTLAAGCWLLLLSQAVYKLVNISFVLIQVSSLKTHTFPDKQSYLSSPQPPLEQRQKQMIKTMDPLAVLENKAVNVVNGLETDAEPDNETIKRWERLFHYSSTEAAERIKRHRNNLSRVNVSYEHWEIVRAEKEAEGYDREAYEYALTLASKLAAPSSPPVATAAADPSESQKGSKFILELEGPLNTANKVQEVGGLASTPSVFSGVDDSGEESFFCHVNSEEKQAILKGLSNFDFRPTFIRMSKAEKDLSSTSIYPTLGKDSTLPQHRLSDSDTPPTPAQDEYPVWYVFYGTLADPAFLAQLLSLSEEPELRPARVEGAAIRSWAGKYKAAVDDPVSAHNTIDGYAYRVASSIHEETLRYYETEKYEVVRCPIIMKDTGELINGLTFRFAGGYQELD